MKRQSTTSMYDEVVELSRYPVLRASLHINTRNSHINTSQSHHIDLEITPSIQYATSQHLPFPPLSASRFDIQDYIHHTLQFSSHPIHTASQIHNLTTSGYDFWEMTYTPTPQSATMKLEFFTSLLNCGLSIYCMMR